MVTARPAARPWSVAAILLPAILGTIRLVGALRRPYYFWGDHAIFEAAIRRVAAGTQTLGPYSRFKFHQPGPAYFDVQAPLYWLTGSNPRAMFLGAFGLNLGSALGSVLLIRWLFSERAAQWAALVIGAYLLALGPRIVADPWPPYVLGLPFLLTMLLATAATRSVAAGAGALVGATYLLQTHVATASAVIAVLATAAVVAVAVRVAGREATDECERARPASPRYTRAMLAAAAMVLVIFWVPPLVQQVTQEPGNITTLARFFTSSHAQFDRGTDHSLHASAGQVTRQLAVLPGGWDPKVSPTSTFDVAVALSGLLAAVGVAVVGWRRRDAALAALGALPVAGTIAAIWSTSRIVGETLPYLLLWASALLLPAWIGAGVLALERLPANSVRRPRPRLLAIGLAAVAATGGLAVLKASWPPLQSSGDVAAGSGLVRTWLADRDVRRVRIEFSDHDTWPFAAGIINQIERKGTDVTVDGNYTFLFGDQFEPRGTEGATVLLSPPAAVAPGPSFERLGEAGGMTFWAGLVGPDRR